MLNPLGANEWTDLPRAKRFVHKGRADFVSDQFRDGERVVAIRFRTFDQPCEPRTVPHGFEPRASAYISPSNQEGFLPYPQATLSGSIRYPGIAMSGYNSPQMERRLVAAGLR